VHEKRGQLYDGLALLILVGAHSTQTVREGESERVSEADRGKGTHVSQEESRSTRSANARDSFSSFERNFNAFIAPPLLAIPHHDPTDARFSYSSTRRA
jgi:hypothetical protein